MNKASKITSIIALSTALSFTAATPSYALFGGGFSSAGIIAAVNKVKDSVLGGFNTLNLTNIMGFGQMTQNSQSEIAAEARMREAEQSLDLMRRVEEQKIKARDLSANTRMECVIITRSQYMQGDVQADTVVSASVEKSLAQMAALDLGIAIGDSGTPIKSDNIAEKSHQIVTNFEGMFNDPNGPAIEDAVLAGKNVLRDAASVDDTNRETYEAACKSYAQISNGSARESLAWADAANEADSAEAKLGIYSDKMRSSLGQAMIMQACAKNDPKVFKDASPDLHAHYLKIAQENTSFAGLVSGGISINEARKIRGHEWLLTAEEANEEGEAQVLRKLLMATGAQNFQNYELQETLDHTNNILSQVLLSVNEQVVLTRKLLEKE
jgi:hypothetical protein